MILLGVLITKLEAVKDRAFAAMVEQKDREFLSMII